MTSEFLKEIENDLHALVDKVKSATVTVVTDVDTEIQPGIAYLKANVPAAAIKIGESILAAEIAGTPWASLVTMLITQAEASGITLAEQAAGIALNYAQSNLLATGALPPVVAPISTPDSAPEAAPAA